MSDQAQIYSSILSCTNKDIVYILACLECIWDELKWLEQFVPTKPGSYQICLEEFTVIIWQPGGVFFSPSRLSNHVHLRAIYRKTKDTASARPCSVGVYIRVVDTAQYMVLYLPRAIDRNFARSCRKYCTIVLTFGL